MMAEQPDHDPKSEIAHYEVVAQTSEKRQELLDRLLRVRAQGANWMVPESVWVETPFDSVAQADVYRHIAPAVPGGVVLQVGGTGLAVLKALLGGRKRGSS